MPNAIVRVLDFDRADGISMARQRSAERPTPVREWSVVAGGEFELIAPVGCGDGRSAGAPTVCVQHAHVQVVVAVRGRRCDPDEGCQHSPANECGSAGARCEKQKAGAEHALREYS